MDPVSASEPLVAGTATHPLDRDRVRAGRGPGWRDRGPDAKAQRPVLATDSAHELGGGRPGREVVGGSGQAGATANQEGAADHGARDPRDRVLASYAGDQGAGGCEPASDRRAPRPAGHRFGAGDQICQPVTIARRPRGAGRPHRMQEPHCGREFRRLPVEPAEPSGLKTNSPPLTSLLRPHRALRARALPTAWLRERLLGLPLPMRSAPPACSQTNALRGRGR